MPSCGFLTASLYGGDGLVLVAVVTLPVPLDQRGVVRAEAVIRHLAGSAPIAGLRLVERLDRISFETVRFLQMVGHLDHVLGELLGIGEIVCIGVVPTGGVAALGQEPRRGVREHLDMVEVAGLQTVLEPPFLGRALIPVVMGVVGRIERFGHLVLVGLLGFHAADRVGPVAGNRGALPHERIPVGHVGGVAAADVVPGHVQI